MKLLTITLFVLKINLIQTLTKCCENQYKLIQDDGEFKCVYDNSTNLNVETTNYGIPEDCSGIETCIDTFNDSIIRINCNRTKSPIIFPVRKCCRFDTMYDQELSSCGLVDGVPLLIPSYLDDDPAELNTSPQCAGIVYDGVFMDALHVRTHEGKLKILHHGDGVLLGDGFLSKKIAFDLGKNCVDRTDDHNFIIKGCQNYEICEEMCGNKCCPRDSLDLKPNDGNDTYNCLPGGPVQIKKLQIGIMKIFTVKLKIEPKMFGLSYDYNVTCNRRMISMIDLLFKKRHESEAGSNEYTNCISNALNNRTGNGTTVLFFCRSEVSFFDFFSLELFGFITCFNLILIFSYKKRNKTIKHQIKPKNTAIILLRV